jgi:hypothetical protein
MKIAVSIDSSAWNWLFRNAIDISVALPPEEFSLFVTLHIESEILAIPEEGADGSDNRPLKRYIRESISRNQVATTATFGFAEANPPDGPATFAGFGQGTFQSDVERAWYARDDVRKQVIGKHPRKPGLLPKNAADASMGAASFNGVALTCDKNKGPIKTASKLGGNVVFLSGPLDAISLRETLRKSAQQSVQLSE